MLQEIIAPFALENLGCLGTETRLLDCPVANETIGDDDDYNYRYSEYTSPADCDPFSGTFAQVSCGTSEVAGVGQGALHSNTRHGSWSDSSVLFADMQH